MNPEQAPQHEQGLSPKEQLKKIKKWTTLLMGILSVQQSVASTDADSGRNAADQAFAAGVPTVETSYTASSDAPDANDGNYAELYPDNDREIILHIGFEEAFDTDKAELNEHGKQIIDRLKEAFLDEIRRDGGIQNFREKLLTREYRIVLSLSSDPRDTRYGDPEDKWKKENNIQLTRDRARNLEQAVRTTLKRGFSRAFQDNPAALNQLLNITVETPYDYQNGVWDESQARDLYNRLNLQEQYDGRNFDELSEEEKWEVYRTARIFIERIKRPIEDPLQHPDNLYLLLDGSGSATVVDQFGEGIQNRFTSRIRNKTTRIGIYTEELVDADESQAGHQPFADISSNEDWKDLVNRHRDVAKETAALGRSQDEQVTLRAAEALDDALQNTNPYEQTGIVVLTTEGIDLRGIVNVSRAINQAKQDNKFIDITYIVATPDREGKNPYVLSLQDVNEYIEHTLDEFNKAASKGDLDDPKHNNTFGALLALDLSGVRRASITELKDPTTSGTVNWNKPENQALLRKFVLEYASLVPIQGKGGFRLEFRSNTGKVATELLKKFAP